MPEDPKKQAVAGAEDPESTKVEGRGKGTVKSTRRPKVVSEEVGRTLFLRCLA